MGLSRTAIAIVVLLLSIGAPLVLTAVIAFVAAPSLLQVLTLCVAVALWMIVLVLVNWWEFTGSWLKWSWVGLVAISIALRLRGSSDLPAVAPANFATIVMGVAAATGLVLVAIVLSARSPHAPPIDLAMPLAGGRFLVTDGGDGARSFLVNYHYGFGRHRAAGVARSMRYATDIVEVGPAGAGCRGFLPRRNDAFRIWEKPLFAPCDGRVAHVMDGIADNDAFGSHRPYGVGNHVVIQANDDVYVVLGHLRQGSVAVVAGRTLKAGEPIGRVGNSGWTERPHVHLQAMRSTDGDWWRGEPVPMRFAGRFLVRNQRFDA